MGIPLTFENFMDRYIMPFYIDGIYLDDVKSIHGLYRAHMLRCHTIEEMRAVARKFQFLAWGVEKDLKQVIMPSQVIRLRRLVSGGKTAALQYANFILPPVMLHAYLISKECGLPEYPAAVQFVASQLMKPENKKELNNG